MAVGDYLKPQRSPLSVYDEQLAQMLRQQSAGIGPQDIAAESYGGKFPVGTMTAKVLGGVLANAKEKSALNRETQAQKARALYAQYLRTGKFGDKTVDAEGNIMEMTEQPMFREEQVLSMVPSGTNAMGTPSLGRAPDVTVAQNQVRDLTAQVPTASSVGETSDPSWVDRTFSGEVKQDAYKNLSEIRAAGNIDEIEAFEYEQALEKANAPDYQVKEYKGNIFYYDKNKPAGGQWIQNPNPLQEGFKVLSADEAALKGLPALGEGAFYQIDTENDRVYKTGTDKGTTVEVTNYMGAGEASKYGSKAVVERHMKDQENKYGVEGALSANRASMQVGNTLLSLIEGGVDTGMWAPYKKFLLRVGEATGWLNEKDLKELGALEGFQAEANQIVLKFIKNLGRNPTDLDLKFMIQTMPNLSKSKLANEYIIKSRMIGAQYIMEALNWEKNYIMDRNSELMNLPSNHEDYGKRVHTDSDEINKLDIARRDYTKEQQILMDKQFKEVRALVKIQKDEDKGIVVVSTDDINAMEKDMNNNNNTPVVNPNPPVVNPNQPPPILTQPNNQVMPPKPFNYDMEIGKLKNDLLTATGNRRESIVNEIELLMLEKNKQRMKNI